MQEYLVRFAQKHEDFRMQELRALADLTGVEMEVVEYSENSPFCIIRLPSPEAAKKLIHRSILANGIYELWATASTYETLHNTVKSHTTHHWPNFMTCSFRFNLQCYRGGSRTKEEIRDIIQSFSYLGFEGPIRMKNPDEEFCIFEDYEDGPGDDLVDNQDTPLQRIFFGRYISGTERSRGTINMYDLKKRLYISTTSMDAELTLITANLVHARPGTLFLDPFVGTGSFPVACAHFGSHCLGSDMDGRMIRGKPPRTVFGNFKSYKLEDKWMDGFISDLTNTPLRIRNLPGSSGHKGMLDGIICDPPYGVREGLKVLGRRYGEDTKGPIWLQADEEKGLEAGWAHLREGFVPPKRPYGFQEMLADILEFAFEMLVEGGKLGMWVPVVNDEVEGGKENGEKKQGGGEVGIPMHVGLELKSVSVQCFNKWSRRLIVYSRKREDEIDHAAVEGRKKERLISGKVYANDLNPFRKRFFEGFRDQSESGSPGVNSESQNVGALMGP